MAIGAKRSQPAFLREKIQYTKKVKFQQVLDQTELYRQELPDSNFTHFPLFILFTP